ncbi:MAG: exeA [candidate division NC10 bacterium]|jgi:general secretion pathway protein A|nr:exeA [candidate division NC10 bacterium]
MYTSHFGFKALPFSISPDPRYLYMSDRHRVGLAHLVYGVQQHGGFVQLTGEVGTGKTTLCRCLLEQLPPAVDVALILNPRVTVVEFLASVCDELRIGRPAGTAGIAALVDALHRYLLDAHARGRRTVLIVDEAQQLSWTVLEQVRLLTNLETSTQKLLHIILIGQPELSTLLAERRMRQLSQRVTARYHLVPLRRAQTNAYVQHRLRVAGGDTGLFTAAAIRAVHRRSGGVPRMINVLCDRALLAAYARGTRRVTTATVRLAARDIQGSARRRGEALRFAWRAGMAVLGICALAGALLAASGRVATVREPGPPPVQASEIRTATLPPLAASERAPQHDAGAPSGPSGGEGQRPDPAKVGQLRGILEAIRLEQQDARSSQRADRRRDAGASAASPRRLTQGSGIAGPTAPVR